MIFQRKRHNPFLLVLFGVLSLSLIGQAQNPDRPDYFLEIQARAIRTSQAFVLPIEPGSIPFSQYQYLVFEVAHQNPASSILILGFGRAGDSLNQSGVLPNRLYTRIGILRNLPTQIIFPLDYLDGEKIFLPRFPRQLKGTVSGKRIDPKTLAQIYFGLQVHQGFDYPEGLIIKNIRLTTELPEPLEAEKTPWVDSLGQFALKDWPGKIKTTQQLIPQFHNSLLTWGLEDPPTDRSPFFGWTKLRFDSTGYFHTHHDGARWWLVDPLGYAYLSVGPTGVGPGSDGPIEGQEDLFQYLPNQDKYPSVYRRVRNRKSISFSTLNLMRIFGSTWQEDWIPATKKLLTGLGFTGTGNWSSSAFHQKGKMPYVLPMSGFPITEIKVFRDFPDVFDPVFEESAAHFASQLDARKNDPWMIGYFLGNEPHWAFGNFNLAQEMLYKNQGSFTRKELISWLREKYEGDIGALAAAWSLELNAFADLRERVFTHESEYTDEALEDLAEFSNLMIDRYAQIICTATRQAAPNHLNLGLRYAWISSPACIQTGKYFDVFSLNGYSFPAPPETESLAEELEMPILIGEFHFGSTDRGLPATGIKGVASQKDRGIAYRYYIESGIARPEIIGMHYFQWHDQMVTGRFDGENYNIGIIDVCYQPYPELAKRIIQTNHRLYQIAAGSLKPTRRKAKAMPSIYY